MLSRLRSYIDARNHRNQLRKWDRILAQIPNLPLSKLREIRRETRQESRRLIDAHHQLERRLTLPVIGSRAFRKAPQTQWAHRPMPWAGPLIPTGKIMVPNKTYFGEDLQIFHDCRNTELSLRQVRNTREDDLAPFGVRMDVFNFSGSFLSFAIELPKEALDGLTRNHLLRLNMIVESERPQEMFARLNLRYGPNTEQIVRELDLGKRELWVEFDLYYTKYNEVRGEAVWIDLIFESPSMNQVTIRDVAVMRRPRATI